MDGQEFVLYLLAKRFVSYLKFKDVGPEGPRQKKPYPQELLFRHKAILTDFVYLAGTFHAKLNNEISKPVSEQLYPKLKRELEVLKDFPPKNLRRICRTEFKILHKELGSAFRIQPRIMLFGHKRCERLVEAELEQDLSIVTHCDCGCCASRVQMDGDTASTSGQKNMSVENTGFREVANYGRSFVENNIPKAVAHNRSPYRNRRLNAQSARAYKVDLSRRMLLLIYRLGVKKWSADPKWTKSWNNSIYASAERDAYKSTMITPITFRHTELSDDVVIGLNLNRKSDGQAHKVLGYICVDHPEPGFFNKHRRLAIESLADCLAPYFAVMANVTTESHSVKKANRRLDETSQNVIKICDNNGNLLHWFKERRKQGASEDHRSTERRLRKNEDLL